MNLAIYSCNWSEADLKFRKLLLLTMYMNNANQTVIRITPKKIVNLQLFADVINYSALLITTRNQNICAFAFRLKLLRGFKHGR